MPKKARTFRLSESAIAILTKYKTTDLTDALETALQRLAYLEDQAQPKQPEAPECMRRITFMAKFYCVQTTSRGLKALKALPTLDICNVCKIEKAGVQVPPRTSEPQPLPKKATVQGTVYCNLQGMHVYIGKCETCQKPCEHAPDTNRFLSITEQIRRKNLHKDVH
jgi:hypothetical protein